MRCQREGCGGLLLHREIVTEEGLLQQWYCSGCARIQESKVEAPYQPYRVRFTEDVEAALESRADGVSRSPNRVDPGIDGSAGIALPPASLEGPDADTGWWD